MYRNKLFFCHVSREHLFHVAKQSAFDLPLKVRHTNNFNLNPAATFLVSLIGTLRIKKRKIKTFNANKIGN